MNNKRKELIDLERKAITRGSPRIGEWIEKKIGSTDFATWTEKQWEDFLHQVIILHSHAMNEVCADDEIPF